MAKKKNQFEFKVLIEQDGDGMYVASVPELPGCYTQGKSLDIVRKRIREVISLVLDSEKDIVREKIKQPSSKGPKFIGIEDITVNYA